MNGTNDDRRGDFTERVMTALATLPDPTPTRTFVEAVRNGSPRDALATLSVAWHLGTVRTWPVSTRVRARSFALLLAAVTLLGTGSLAAAAAVHVVTSVPGGQPTVEPAGAVPEGNPTLTDPSDSAVETATPTARDPGPDAEPSTEPLPSKHAPAGHDEAGSTDGPTRSDRPRRTDDPADRGGSQPPKDDDGDDGSSDGKGGGDEADDSSDGDDASDDGDSSHDGGSGE